MGEFIWSLFIQWSLLLVLFFLSTSAQFILCANENLLSKKSKQTSNEKRKITIRYKHEFLVILTFGKNGRSYISLIFRNFLVSWVCFSHLDNIQWHFISTLLICNVNIDVVLTNRISHTFQLWHYSRTDWCKWWTSCTSCNFTPIMFHSIVNNFLHSSS